MCDDNVEQAVITELLIRFCQEFHIVRFLVRCLYFWYPYCGVALKNELFSICYITMGNKLTCFNTYIF